MAHNAAWRLAKARRAEDSPAASLATGQLLETTQANLPEVLCLSVDSFTEFIVEWADELRVNPACLADASVGRMPSALGATSRLIIVSSLWFLSSLDPFGEVGRKHPVSLCQAWPDDYLVPSVTDVNQGESVGGILEGISVLNALTDVSQRTGRTVGFSGLSMLMALPDVLWWLAWSRSGSDNVRMLFLVEEWCNRGTAH